jgi:hypothetical protein
MSRRWDWEFSKFPFEIGSGIDEVRNAKLLMCLTWETSRRGTKYASLCSCLFLFSKTRFGPPLLLRTIARQQYCLVVYMLLSAQLGMFSNCGRWSGLAHSRRRLGASLVIFGSGGELLIVRQESGGPPSAGLPKREGLGALLIRQVTTQFGGQVSYARESEGLTVHLSVPLQKLAM